MESRNLITAFVSIFVIAISVATFWVGESYVAGIGGPYVASVLLFIVALIPSMVMWQKTKKIEIEFACILTFPYAASLRCGSIEGFEKDK